MAQFTRCGCQTECPCVLIGGEGIEVTGTGNPDDPYVISTDGTIDCDLVSGCICAKIVGNTGIRCNAQGNIELFISGDAGNIMSFGQDGGLKAMCEECTNLPENCSRSVTDLDTKVAQKQFVWGTYQGGRLVVPWGTHRSIDHAVAIQSDIDVQWVSSLKGCGAAIFPYPTFCSDRWTAHYNYARGAQAYCDSIAYYKLSPAQWQNFTINVERYYDAGWDNRAADGGVLLSNVYGRNDNKLINALFLSATETYGSVVSTIRYWCMQRRTIIHHWNPQRLAQAVGAGIPAGIMCFAGEQNPDSPWAGNWTPTLAAEAAAAGATWAAVSLRLTDAQIATFPAAGLKTMGFDTFRRVDVMRAVNLGLVGLYSDDMIYQRYEEVLNPIPGFIPHPNRTCFVPYDRSTWGVGSAGSGQLFPPENPTSFKTRRGYFRQATAPTNTITGGVQAPCWHLPSNWGDYNATQEEQDAIPAMLVGDVSAWSGLSNAGGYRITYWAGWVNADQSLYGEDNDTIPNPPANPTSTVDKYGIFFGAPTDKNISGPNARRDQGAAKAAEGYFCFIRPSNGEIVIGSRNADEGAAGTGWMTLVDSGAQTAVPANQLWSFQIEVTPGTAGGDGTITFRTNPPGAGAPYEVTVTNANAGKFRGPYVYIAKEELDGVEFECRFAEVNIDRLNAEGQVMTRMSLDETMPEDV